MMKQIEENCLCKHIEKCANQKWNSHLQAMVCDWDEAENCRYCLIQ